MYKSKNNVLSNKTVSELYNYNNKNYIIGNFRIF